MESSGRLWLVLAAAIVAAAVGASVWMAAIDPLPPPQQVGTPLAAEPSPLPAPVPAPAEAPVSAAPSPSPATPVPTRPAPAASAPIPPTRNPVAATPTPPPLSTSSVVVDSSERGYPLSAWRIGQNVGGWIDAPAWGDRPLDDQAVVEVTGWAGDSEVGWKARTVAIAVCGTVVASAKVDLPRPEVARNAHPNLGQSGWRARIAVAHLPRCTDARLQAVAQIGTGRSALPLMGNRPIALAPAGGPKPNLLSPPSPVLPPDADPEPRALRLNGTVNVRRCADVQCDMRGRLPAGTHRAVVGEETAGWLLVAVPASNMTGWISKQAVAGLAPAARR